MSDTEPHSPRRDDTAGDRGFLPRDALQRLFDALIADGYQVVAPSVVDHAIQYVPLDDAGQLPRGWQDTQRPGHYRLHQADHTRCFAWADGPQALKPYLFKARETLWRSRRDPHGGLIFDAEEPKPTPLAVLGVRACDLAALALHDRHFLDRIADPCYAAQREKLLLIALHCTHPATTCFCASTGDGPQARDGFDLAMHELDDGYLIEAGSPAGRSLLQALPLLPPRAEQAADATAAIEQAAAAQQRALPPGNLHDRLFAALDNPRWRAVAERCLSCGNCTSVCPTCFCHQETDLPALGGDSSAHVREWDSCFTQGHSYMHGFIVRPETEHRYRQWLTHKLGSWHQQYGRSGCVGCGRCITWCPVGIDITEEAGAICGDTPDQGDSV